MSEQSIFTFTNLEGEQKNIRTVTLEGAVWFVAADVCAILGHKKVWNALLPLEAMEKGTHRMSTLGGTQKLSIISESGLYRLIMRSDKPNARPFQDWVTKVVLPTIRKEGVYIRGEEKIAKVSNLSELEDLQEQMLNLAGRKAQILEDMLKKAEDRIAELEPQAEAYSFVFDQDGLVRLRTAQLAVHERHPSINLNLMTPTLVELGFIYREERSNALRVRQSGAVNGMGLFSERVTRVEHLSSEYTRSALFVTQEGVKLLFSLARDGKFPNKKGTGSLGKK